MTRPPSALVAIGGFGVFVAALSVAATAAVVVFAPQPPPTRVRPATALAALRGETDGFVRSYTDSPPTGLRATLVERLLANALGRPQDDVRAVWQERALARVTSRVAPPSAVTFVRLAPSRSLPPVVVFKSSPGSSERIESSILSDATQDALMAMPLPAFVTSVRGADRRWLTVEPARPLLSGWQRNVLIALAISLLMLAPLAWVFARRLTRPFRQMAHALQHDGDTLPVTGPRELREAAQAIASMRTRLHAETAELLRMLSAVAHDLRTPLTSLRLRIEMAPQPQRQRMVADVERMERMIGEVLDFTRDPTLQRTRVAVRPFLARVVAEADDGRGLLRLLPGEDGAVIASPLGLRRAVENLLRNAADYAGSGEVRIEREGDQLAISVCDRGPGIPAADRDRLLRPFERGEASRNRATGGVGLGLSLVNDLATQHGGSFALLDREGGDTVAKLCLPLAIASD